jgi:hypothetical protein
LTGINYKLNYARRRDLKSSGHHLVIIEIKANQNSRNINIYRPFTPPGDISARAFTPFI